MSAKHRALALREEEPLFEIFAQPTHGARIAPRGQQDPPFEREEVARLLASSLRGRRDEEQIAPSGVVTTVARLPTAAQPGHVVDTVDAIGVEPDHSAGEGVLSLNRPVQCVDGVASTIRVPSAPVAGADDSGLDTPLCLSRDGHGRLLSPHCAVLTWRRTTFRARKYDRSGHRTTSGTAISWARSGSYATPS